jgi:hypothetical protein
MQNVGKTSLKILSILVLSLFAFQLSFSQVKNTPASEIALADEFPSGKWSISYHPYQGENSSNLPVAVYSVVSKNLKVTQIRITNVSTKPIKAIKVRWLVYENQNRDNLLAQGQTSLIRFVGSIDSGNSGTITYPVVSFADVHKNFLVNGKLDKDFNVDLLVDEVTYLDGSTWLAKNGNSKDVIANLFKKVSFQDCAKQTCKGTASTTIRGGTTYSCVASSLNEYCSNSGSSCTNNSCAGGGGGGGTISPEVPVEN